METSKQQEMKGSAKVSNLMLQKVLLLAAKRTLNIYPQNAWPWLLLLLWAESQTSKPTAVWEVPGMKSPSQSPRPYRYYSWLIPYNCRLGDPWRAENQQEGVASLAVCVVHASARWCHSQPEQTSYTSFTSSPCKGPFGLWSSKQGLQLSAETAVLSDLYHNFPSNSFLGASGTAGPASLHFSLLMWVFLGISHQLHSHNPGTAP